MSLEICHFIILVWYPTTKLKSLPWPTYNPTRWQWVHLRLELHLHNMKFKRQTKNPPTKSDLHTMKWIDFDLIDLIRSNIMIWLNLRVQPSISYPQEGKPNKQPSCNNAAKSARQLSTFSGHLNNKSLKPKFSIVLH